jgi:hypothetical protein
MWAHEVVSVPAPSQEEVEKSMTKLGSFKRMELSYKKDLQPSDERLGEINSVSCIYSIYPEFFMGLNHVSDIWVTATVDSNNFSKLSVDQKILEKAKKSNYDGVHHAVWANDIEFTINPKSQDNR